MHTYKDKYLVWTDDGCEGWSLSIYDTLEEAVKHESYGKNIIITKKVRYTVKEIE